MVWIDGNVQYSYNISDYENEYENKNESETSKEVDESYRD